MKAKLKNQYGGHIVEITGVRVNEDEMMILDNETGWKYRMRFEWVDEEVENEIMLQRMK